MGANGTVKKTKLNKNKIKENKSARTKNVFDSKIKQKKHQGTTQHSWAKLFNEMDKEMS